MPIGNNSGLEYIHLKAFLYKFTPPFVSSGLKVTGQQKTNIVNVELDDSKYFSRYDITDYVVGFNASAKVREMSVGWSITLSDPVIDSKTLDLLVRSTDDTPKLFENNFATPKVRSVVPSAARGAALTRLSNYETSSPKTITSADVSTFDGELDAAPDRVLSSKLFRGQAEAQMTERASGKAPILFGLRLSDLIQPYDFVSVFVYKGTTPLFQLPGILDVSDTFLPESSKLARVRQFIVSPSGTDFLTEDLLKHESILLSPISPDARSTLFTPEINGFVVAKTVSRTAGGPDTVSISGLGVTKLLSSTRRVTTPGLRQSSLYSFAELASPFEVSGRQTVFADKTLTGIFDSLFDLGLGVTRVGDDTVQIATGQVGSNLLAGSSQVEETQGASLTFYDISKTQVFGTFQGLRLGLPIFLLGCVMKRRFFNFRAFTHDQPVATSAQLIADTTGSIGTPIGSTSTDFSSFADTSMQVALATTTQVQDVFLSGHQPITYDFDPETMRAYFQFFSQALTEYSPETSTPYDILQEIKSITFLEIFEDFDGTIKVRSPKYNEVSNIVFSSDLDVISTSYEEDATQILTRLQTLYALDGNPTVKALKTFSYTDGKLLMQYGLLESTADANPNTQTKKNTDLQRTLDRDFILFRYAEFFLRVHNAGLKTGSMECNWTPSVKLGSLIFDVKNNKLGYVVGIDYTFKVGTPMTMNLTFAYVRDAYSNDPGRKDPLTVIFEKLPLLEDISRKE